MKLTKHVPPPASRVWSGIWPGTSSASGGYNLRLRSIVPRWRGLGVDSISKLSLHFCLPLLLCLFSCQEKTPPNVLFIAIDDLRPDLGCYGQSFVHSPNIDRLGAESFVFRNHYVSVPTCGASRHSLLTGMRPTQSLHVRNDVSRILLSRAGQLSPEDPPETFIHHLRRQGYYTVGIGKISHAPGGRSYAKEKEPESDSLELPNSWDEMLLNAGKWGDDWGAFFGYANGKDRYYYNKQVKPYEAADVPDEGYPDGLSALLAMKKLQELSQKEEPFFLGVGFFKPHLPFTAPQKYWDLYEESELPVSPVPDLPDFVHPASLHPSGELNQYALGEEKAGLDHNLSDEYARKLRHAYYACVSYVDAQVGKVLDELDRLGLAENTVVVLWSDHGWHLGDHRVWGKHTVFETALRSPLLIRIPGQEDQARAVEKVVSSVDIYPTLMELSQLQMPHETDGRSLVPLMLNPAETEWEQAAYSYFRRRISLRTGYYRFNRYFREEGPNVELFDHRKDPHEQYNLAGKETELVRDFLSYTPQTDWDWPNIAPSTSYSQLPISDGFDYPVGPPNARAYYNAQPFGENEHLGDDWNGVGGGNTDLGDPVYSIASGVVIKTTDKGAGWGKVVRVLHQLNEEEQIESLYAHLDSISVRVGQRLKRGTQIGTIGDAHGTYLAHLHLEIRNKVGMPLGGGYGRETNGYLDPTAFIKEHRPR